MSHLPPGSRPTGANPDEPDQRRSRQRILAGIGIPAFGAALLAWLLGIPWWIVIGFCVVVAVSLLGTF